MVWRNPRLRWSVIGFHLVLGSYALVVLFPIITMLLGSVKSTRDLIVNPFGWPQEFVWSNYLRAWSEANFAVYFKNSLYVTITSTVATLLAASMASFVLARIRFRLSSFILGLFIAGLVVPSRLSIIPLFLLVRDMGLMNTHLALILIYVGTSMPFDIFLLTTFFRQVPNELAEAAVVEGAGMWTVYWRIMMPLVRPALATVAIFEALGAWNDFFFPLIFLRDKKLMTVPVGLSVFFGEYATDWPTLFAALAISILPVIVMFAFMSRQFIAGLTQGAVK